MNSAGDDNSTTEFAQSRVAIIGYMYVAPTLITMGLVGSFASMATLSHRKFSGRFFTYLKALALADICFLCFAVAG